MDGLDIGSLERVTGGSRIIMCFSKNVFAVRQIEDLMLVLSQTSPGNPLRQLVGPPPRRLSCFLMNMQEKTIVYIYLYIH